MKIIYKEIEFDSYFVVDKVTGQEFDDSCPGTLPKVGFVDVYICPDHIVACNLFTEAEISPAELENILRYDPDPYVCCIDQCHNLGAQEVTLNPVECEEGP